jgi:RHS repeat-associated protein
MTSNAQWYEMFFRGYDPALGRMLQIDPVASKYASVSPYNYSFNDPVALNDPSGADPYDPNHYYHRGGPYNSNAYFYTDMVNADGGFPYKDRGDPIYGNEGLHSRVFGRVDMSWAPDFYGPVLMGFNEIGNAIYKLPSQIERAERQAMLRAASVEGGGMLHIDIDWNQLPSNSITSLFFNKGKFIGGFQGQLEMKSIEPVLTCNEPGCTHAMLGPRVEYTLTGNRYAGVGESSGLSNSFYLNMGFSGTKKSVAAIGNEINNQRAINKSLNPSSPHGQSIKVPKGLKIIGRFGGPVISFYGAVEIEMQFEQGGFNSYQRYVEHSSNLIGAVPAVGTAWSFGWEIGRGITNMEGYQQWKQNVWLPWRRDVLGY